MPVIEVGTSVDVGVEEAPIVEVIFPSADVDVNFPMTGPAGATSSAYVHTQLTPSASWIISNPFARICDVTVYVNDEQVDTDVTVTISVINIIFPTPVSGVAIIT